MRAVCLHYPDLWVVYDDDGTEVGRYDNQSDIRDDYPGLIVGHGFGDGDFEQHDKDFGYDTPSRPEPVLDGPFPRKPTSDEVDAAMAEMFETTRYINPSDVDLTQPADADDDD